MAKGIEPKGLEILVVVVTWNSARFIRNWLNSVQRLANGNDEVKPVAYVVDNGSSDGTAGILTQPQWSKLIKDIHWLPRNYGFNAAQNIAFRKIMATGKYKYVATLNHDATAEPSWLEELSRVAVQSNDQDGVGMLSGPISDTVDRPVMSSGGHTFCGHNGKVYDIHWGDSIDSCDSLDGKDTVFVPCFAAALWRVEMLREVGLPDSEQFMYYDDIELGFKARLNRWTGKFVKGAIAHHPIPTKRAEPHLIECQLRGRVASIARYYPKPEREQALERVKAESGTQWEMVQRTSTLISEFSDTDRRRVFDAWTDRNRTCSLNRRR